MLINVPIPRTVKELNQKLFSNKMKEMEQGYADIYLFVNHLVRTKGDKFLKELINSKNLSFDELESMYEAFARDLSQYQKTISRFIALNHLY